MQPPTEQPPVDAGDEPTYRCSSGSEFVTQNDGGGVNGGGATSTVSIPSCFVQLPPVGVGCPCCHS